MRRATILHGTDGTPEINWLPWLALELQSRGYEVFAPLLPENHTPNRLVYDAFLGEQKWDYSDNLLVGHSSGATTAINLLSSSDWFPRVKRTILVGTFLNEDLLDEASWYEKGQFDHLFQDSVDMEKMKDRCKDIIFVHGDNDPYCSFEDASKFCSELKGKMVTVKNGLHLSSNRIELEEIIPYI